MDRTDTGDIRILERTTVREIGDRVEVEWRLSRTPELEWSEIFQMADVSERHGALEWVVGGGPDVLRDTIRWFVPSKNIPDAEAEVRHRLFMANGRFATEYQGPDGEVQAESPPTDRIGNPGSADRANLHRPDPTGQRR